MPSEPPSDLAIPLTRQHLRRLREVYRSAGWPSQDTLEMGRADLLGDLKKPSKRAAYLGMGGECWYVLGQTANGKPIAVPDEVPPECGVMLCEGDRLVVARPAPRRALEKLPFHVWMSLAKAGPAVRGGEEEQEHL